jgi:alpha-1,2-mannosyltransferase
VAVVPWRETGLRRFGGPVNPARAREWISGRTLFVAVTAVLATAELRWATGAHHFFDLRVYQGALRSWMHGGSLYGFVMPPGDRYGFTYPPLAALALVPLALMPTGAAAAATVAATMAATVAVVALVTGRRPWPAAPRRHQIVGVATLAVLALLATRTTLAEGQINMYMLALVVADLLYLSGGRWHGAGVGLAAAIKLTPAVFVPYLLITGQRRAAATACGTFAGCAVVGIAVAPRESVEFWTRVLWETNRVGSAGSISNESIRGVLARVSSGNVTPWWLATAGLLTAIWWRRVRRAGALGDDVGGLAVTGAFACLVAPITWIHHQVFLIPALVVVASRALAPQPARPTAGRRRVRAAGRIAAGLAFAVLIVEVDKLARHGGRLPMLLVGDAPVWVALGLLLLPLRPEARSAYGAPLPPGATAPVDPQPGGGRSKPV